MYVKQLAEDLRQAQGNPRPPKMELDPDLEFVRGAEEYLHGPTYTLTQLSGIGKIAFPPAEKLNEAQLRTLTHEIRELWAVFNFFPVFPENLPAFYQYQMMVSKWEEPMPHITQGSMHVEFCDYEPENCPFPEKYCMCKEF